MKNKVILLTTFIVFIGLIIGPIVIRQDLVMMPSNDGKLLTYKIDYLTYEWEVTFGKNDSLIKKEDMYTYFFEKNIISHIILPLIGMAAFYSIIYAVLFQLAFIFITRLKSLNKKGEAA